MRGRAGARGAAGLAWPSRAGFPPLAAAPAPRTAGPRPASVAPTCCGAGVKQGPGVSTAEAQAHRLAVAPGAHGGSGDPAGSKAGHLLRYSPAKGDLGKDRDIPAPSPIPMALRRSDLCPFLESKRFCVAGTQEQKAPGSREGVVTWRGWIKVNQLH